MVIENQSKCTIMAKYYFWHSSENYSMTSMSFYSMATSVSGQDELNPALWLATQAGKMALSVPQVKFPPNPYNKSLIDQACSVKMAGYWPRSFLRICGLQLHLSKWTHKKRTWSTSSHLDRTSLVNNPYLYTVLLLWQIQSWNLNMTVFWAIYKAS